MSRLGRGRPHGGADVLPALPTSRNASALTAWGTALAGLNSTPAKWLAIGDGVTEGQGASTRANRWIEQALATLRTARSVTGGQGYIPADYQVNGPDSPWAGSQVTYTGTTAVGATDGLGHRYVQLSADVATAPFGTAPFGTAPFGGVGVGGSGSGVGTAPFGTAPFGVGSGGGTTETFTGTNGTTWPGDWATANGAGSGNQTIQGNKGRLLPSGGWASAWRTGTATLTDFDLTVSVNSGAGVVSVGMTPAHTLWNVPDNSHYFRMETGSTQMGYVSIRRSGAGGHTELAFAFSGAAPHATDGWSVRFQRTGTVLKAKVWTAGGSEPGTWLIDVTDPSPPSSPAGKVFFGTSVTADFDDLAMGGGGGGGGGVTAGSVAFTVTGTAVDLWYVSTSTAGTLTYRVDSGSTTPVSTAGAYGLRRVTGIGLGAAGSHTVTVTATSGAVAVAGVMVYHGDAGSGIQLYDAAGTNMTSATYAASMTSITDAATLIAPDLVSIELGLNDSAAGISVAATQANIQTLVAMLRSLPKVPSIALVIPYYPAPSANPNWPDYVAVLRRMATADLSLVLLDLSLTMPPAAVGTGSYRADGLHPSDTGHAQIAARFTDLTNLSVTPGPGPAPASSGNYLLLAGVG